MGPKQGFSASVSSWDSSIPGDFFLFFDASLFRLILIWSRANTTGMIGTSDTLGTRVVLGVLISLIVLSNSRSTLRTDQSNPDNTSSSNSSHSSSRSSSPTFSRKECQASGALLEIECSQWVKALNLLMWS